MGFLKKTFLSASVFPWFKGFVLFCLMMLSLTMGSALSMFDIASIRLYMGEKGVFGLAHNLLLCSFLFFIINAFVYKFRQNKGCNVLFILGLTLLLIITISFGLDGVYKDWFAHFIFVSKYLVWAFFLVAFFSILSRFIRLNIDHLHGVLIYCSLFLGFSFGGGIVYLFSFGAYTILYLSLFLLSCVFLALLFLTEMRPVTKDVFVAKTGEVRDLVELNLVRLIYGFAFFMMFGKCISDFILYKSLYASFDLFQVFKMLSFLWGCFGFLGFALSFLSYKTRYLYMISAGICVLILGFLGVAFGLYYQHFFLVALGYLFVMLSIFLCFERYMEALLTLLNKGLGKSITSRRMILLEPVGFMAGALCCIYMSQYLFWILAFLVFVLALMLVFSLKVYTSLFLYILQIRAWRGGPLILPSRKVVSYIETEIANGRDDDVIYFLRILDVAKSGLYYKYVLKLLKHKSEMVRLFVLEEICSSYDNDKYAKAVEFVFLRDSSPKVRGQALAFIIEKTYASGGLNAINPFLPCLDDKDLKVGAMTGFLRTGGAPALLAIDGIQKLVYSQKVKDNLLALSIMEQAPSMGLIRLLIPLIKSTRSVVASRALRVAGKIAHPESLPIILSCLDDMELRENALVALKSYGVKAFPLIERTLNNPQTPLIRQKVLILFLTMLPSGEGKKILLRALQIGNQKLRKIIVQGMIDRGIFWIHKGKYDLLFEGIQKDSTRLFWLVDFIDKYKNFSLPEVGDAFSFLIRAMQEDLSETRDMILYQLMLYKDDPLLHKALYILLQQKKDLYALAMGTLQDLLPKEMYNVILRVENLLLKEEKQIVNTSVTIETALFDVSNLILNPPFPFPFWIQATALYCLRKLGRVEGLQAVKHALKQTNPLVLEAAIFAYVRLEQDKDEMHRMLLNVPTSSLMHSSLEAILDD